jgi:hypothetical protein
MVVQFTKIIRKCQSHPLRPKGDVARKMKEAANQGGLSTIARPFIRRRSLPRAYEDEAAPGSTIV